jgi:hypothetical protein
MTIEEELLLKYHTDALFIKDIKALRKRWGVDQNKYKSIIDCFNDWIKVPKRKDARDLYLKNIEEKWPYKVFDEWDEKLRELNKDNSDFKTFFDEIDFIVEKHSLPAVCASMIIDLVDKGRLSKGKYARVILEKSIRNPNNFNGDYLTLRIYPEATLKDIKDIYKKYIGLALDLMNNGYKISQPLRLDYSKKIIKKSAVPKITNKELCEKTGIKKDDYNQRYWSGRTIFYRRSMHTAKYRRNKRLNNKKIN